MSSSCILQSTPEVIVVVVPSGCSSSSLRILPLYQGFSQMPERTHVNCKTKSLFTIHSCSSSMARLRHPLFSKRYTSFLEHFPAKPLDKFLFASYHLIERTFNQILGL